MTKTDLLNVIHAHAKAKASTTTVSKAQIAVVFDAVFEALEEILVGTGQVKISGFGTFEKKIRQARVGRNLQTGELVEVPARYAVSFKATENLKRRINPPH